MPKRIAQWGVIVPKIAPISGRYYGHRTSPGFGGTGTTGALVANTLYSVPFFLPTTATVNSIELRITTAAAAGKLIRLGLYDNDPATGFPRTLLADSGALAADTAAPFTAAAAISVVLVAGLLYHLALVTDGTPSCAITTPTLTMYGHADAQGTNSAGFSRSFAYAALPTPWGTPSASYLSLLPTIVVKAA